MNNLYKTLALASALAAATTTTSVSAFAPATQQKIAFSPSPSQSKQRLSNMEPLHMANSGKNTPTEDDLKEQAQKATQFLALNLEQTENQLAKNWKWITASGVVTLALGIESAIRTPRQNLSQRN
jgi:hypothetical protein